MDAATLKLLFTALQAKQALDKGGGSSNLNALTSLLPGSSGGGGGTNPPTGSSLISSSGGALPPAVVENNNVKKKPSGAKQALKHTGLSALDLIGKAISGGGNIVGLGMSTLGSLPSKLQPVSEGRKALYGNTPGQAMSEAVGALSGVAGTGVATLGEALGSTISDSAKTMKLMDLDNIMQAKLLAQAQEIQSMNLSPSSANLAAQLLRSQGIQSRQRGGL